MCGNADQTERNLFFFWGWHTGNAGNFPEYYVFELEKGQKSPKTLTQIIIDFEPVNKWSQNIWDSNLDVNILKLISKERANISIFWLMRH